MDIKVQLGAYNGYLFKGKYYSGETLGNYLFGMDLETARNNTILDNVLGYRKIVSWKVAAKQFGPYNNEHNHTNVPFVWPYYGEIPYSGRGIGLGYHGNDFDNPIFNSPRAIYGNVITKLKKQMSLF